MQRVALVITITLAVVSRAAADSPRVLDDRLKLELFAEHPQIVTPTGIDVDHLGRVWAIESNTHFPPEGYQGHLSDRLLILEDANNDGLADKITVFADGLKHTMSVAVKPVWLDELSVKGQVPSTGTASTTAPTLGTQHSALGTSVFLATRREILLLRDTDGDLKADERHQLVHLETKGDYPHNGLGGFAFDALGWMYFGFGENLGEKYEIIGSDGVTLSGGGEGGNLYRCRPDGSKLERWATGFWNPHASCFDAFGRLFTVDNDPDSRPPCRLLHIIPGGDYGYRFRNGRKGTHPFTAWNGEIPGTLPMVSGTGEAPSGILCYESDGFPADYLGTLLVGSWGDHRIDKFVLEPKGASFTSKPQPIVQGDENFRPVGLALAPDGSVFFTDWVLKDYKLHGKGRVWRLSGNWLADVDSLIRSNKERQSARDERILNSSPVLISRRLAARSLVRDEKTRQLLELTLNNLDVSSRSRIEVLWALASLPEAKLSALFGTPGNQPAFLRKRDEVMEAVFRLARDQKIEVPTDIKTPGDLLDSARARYVGEWIEQYRPDFVKHNLAGVAWVMLFHHESDPFLQYHALHSLGRQKDLSLDPAIFETNGSGESVERLSETYTFLHARRVVPTDARFPRAGLKSPWDDVRFLAVQWVGEEQLKELRPQVEALLNDSRTTPDLMLACLATLSLLDGVPPSEFEKTPPAQYALAMVVDEQRPAALRATALRLLPSSLPELKGELLVALAQSPDRALQTEAVRTLQRSPRPEALPVLMKLAIDANADVSIRADAVSALCGMFPHEAPLPGDVEALLSRYSRGDIPLSDASQKRSELDTLQFEAIRALRGRAGKGSKIGQMLRDGREAASDNQALREALDLALTGKSDPQLSTINTQPPSDSQPESGRRVFFAHQGPLCSKCHTVQGRGGNVGPDLSVIARTMSRQKLIDSILDPSKEVSPYFLTWTISTTSGKVHTGIIVTENGGGDVELGDANGNVIKIPRKEIDERAPSKTSVMPQGLHQRMTTQEFADLLAYLESLK